LSELNKSNNLNNLNNLSPGLVQKIQSGIYDFTGLSPERLLKAYRHLELLKKWNQAFNLTAITDFDEMWIKHVLDSLAILPHLPDTEKFPALKFLDVGTGGGFPGVPLAIARPGWQFFLLDSNAKKIKFLTQIKIALGLNNIFPIHARVECFDLNKLDFKTETDFKFDGILSRAFASLKNMTDQTQHLLAQNGKFYALKGPEEEATPEGKILEADIRLEIPGLQATRRLVVLK
jgi:16S rRNA (guanine527-N7)-methyltransferase